MVIVRFLQNLGRVPSSAKFLRALCERFDGEILSATNLNRRNVFDGEGE